jgi:LDH2 family malate/lactate/ureidoglycolate dehydrogenase
MSEEIRVNIENLRQLCTNIFIKAGLSKDDAFTVADSLVFANLRGVDSHGVMRFPVYIKRLEKGGSKAKPNIKVLKERPASALIDGDSGLGQVIGGYATELAIKKAKEAGVCIVAVKGSAHYGAASYYSVKISQKGMIGVSTSNTTQNTAAWGGAKKIIGNDPLSIAVPYQKDKPLVLDISMSQAAGGKIKLAAKNNQKVPIGWGIDKFGKKTQDPNEIIDGGARLPFGEHKGYGLSVMLEILNGVLTGAGMLSQMTSWSKYPQNPTNIGHCFTAIDITSFMNIKEFNQRLEWFVGEIKSSPLMEGSRGVFMPGEIELNIEKERRDKGIPISKKVWSELLEIAKLYQEEIDSLKL